MAQTDRQEKGKMLKGEESIEKARRTLWIEFIIVSNLKVSGT